MHSQLTAEAPIFFPSPPHTRPFTHTIHTCVLHEPSSRFDALLLDYQRGGKVTRSATVQATSPRIDKKTTSSCFILSRTRSHHGARVANVRTEDAPVVNDESYDCGGSTVRRFALDEGRRGLIVSNLQRNRQRGSRMQSSESPPVCADPARRSTDGVHRARSIRR
ncbi:hypothetical protein BDK51DRAFT_43059 [Blyttiomyces helicus]|uniref:Uncharacterized protein n=1 Tax=Blyttiomyces helicus TaxID=388810 RepID=A0A4P9WEB5_9FUNG|nr:hypothetical protein BDK51DRAFT_43059 [Blyttiomyces helicus]|eukprot:RKO90115.1 hypothetical protein BDK51DRAFT_43059 [Blyttiomyces helicus]